MNEFFKSNKYLLAVWAILLLSFFIRFYHFPVRWGLGNDDARDIMIAQEALRRHELPLIGSFSSAGPFVFGPVFYWFIMFCYLILPVFNSPWLFTGLISVGVVGLFMYCAKKIAGNNFSLLVGLLAASSPQLVARSLSLGQHTFVIVATVCMIVCVLLFLETKRKLFAFLIGLAIGIGINFHYQALNLLLFLGIFFFVPKISLRAKFFALLLAIAGVLVGIAPLLIWDSQQHFANINNLLDYFLIAQYRLYVPNSWRLFLFQFLPNYWGYVSGGTPLIGAFTIIAFTATIIVAVFKKFFPTKLFFLLIPFGMLLFLNRYYKGERSEGYLLYFLPFIILFTAYTIYALLQKGRFALLRKCFAILLLVLIIADNIQLEVKMLVNQSPVANFENFIDQLVEKYPDQKFSVYDYKAALSSDNQPLSALLFKRGLIASDGMPVGFLCYVRCPVLPRIGQANGGLYLADLRSEKSLQTNHKLWVKVNPESMYDDLIGWSKRHELRTTFSLQKYLTEKLHI